MLASLGSYDRTLRATTLTAEEALAAVDHVRSIYISFHQSPYCCSVDVACRADWSCSITATASRSKT